MYEVQFEDGSVDRYHANIISENIYSRIDSEGHSQYMLDEILDHKSDDTAIKQSEGFTVGSKGEQVPKQTTRGWKLLIRLKDHSTSWIKLKDLKESNPMELAEHAKGNALQFEPAFKWWVPHTLRAEEG